MGAYADVTDVRKLSAMWQAETGAFTTTEGQWIDTRLQGVIDSRYRLFDKDLEGYLCTETRWLSGVLKSRTVRTTTDFIGDAIIAAFRSSKNQTIRTLRMRRVLEAMLLSGNNIEDIVHGVIYNSTIYPIVHNHRDKALMQCLSHAILGAFEHNFKNDAFHTKCEINILLVGNATFVRIWAQSYPDIFDAYLRSGIYYRDSIGLHPYRL